MEQPVDILFLTLQQSQELLQQAESSIHYYFPLLTGLLNDILWPSLFRRSDLKIMVVLMPVKSGTSAVLEG